jgi:hypothetical protein
VPNTDVSRLVLNTVSIAELPGSARAEGVKASDAAAIDAPPARTFRRLCVLLIRHLLVREWLVRAASALAALT